MECFYEYAKFYCYVELKNNSSPIAIFNKLNSVYPNNCPAYSSVKLWCREFNHGTRESFIHRPRSGRPCSSRTNENILKIEQLILENPKHSTRSLGSAIGIGKNEVLVILTEDL